MLTLALLVLLQAAPATEPTLEEVRAFCEKSLATFDERVEELSGFVETRFAADSDEPRTGMAVSSPEDVDERGLHPVIVETVVQESPAAQAGVKPGDRIVRIGQRDIEHETPQVIRSLTDGTPGPLELTVLRDGERLTLTVDRTPIACLQRASARIDQEQWRERIVNLKGLSFLAHQGLDDPEIPDPRERYRTTYLRIRQMFGLFDELGHVLGMEMTEAMSQECHFDSR
jgi:C-terminal processing protease CtpA/Prc